MIKNKKFLLLFSSTFFSSFGDAILFVVLLTALQGLETTAISTSYYLLFSALPVLLFGLQIGAFVERKTLQKVMISSDVFRFALIIDCYNMNTITR